jgi:hypothetical protein
MTGVRQWASLSTALSALAGIPYFGDMGRRWI